MFYINWWCLRPEKRTQVEENSMFFIKNYSSFIFGFTLHDLIKKNILEIQGFGSSEPLITMVY